MKKKLAAGALALTIAGIAAKVVYDRKR